jgi:spore germination cell wall hydrolase CwlJ-like protein
MRRHIIVALFLLAAPLAVAGCAQQPYDGPVMAAPAGLPLPPVKPERMSAAGTQFAALPGRFALPQTSRRARLEVSAEERFCLAQAIYFEAGMQNPDEQRAVGDVVINRMRDGRFPDSICGVIHEGGEASRGRCQFSWWCDGLSDETVQPDRWSLAQQSADEVLSGEYADETDGALFFHNKTVRPSWSRKLQKTAVLGAHIFYR